MVRQLANKVKLYAHAHYVLYQNLCRKREEINNYSNKEEYNEANIVINI